MIRYTTDSRTSQIQMASQNWQQILGAFLPTSIACIELPAPARKINMNLEVVIRTHRANLATV